MFVHYFVHVDRPFGQVEPILLEKLTGIPEIAERAYREGEALRAKVLSGDHSFSVAKTVTIEAGSPCRGLLETWIPITWHATGAAQLFPQLEGDVIIGKIDDTLTQVAFRGTYQPPMGAVGQAIDRILLHRVAEAGIKSFIDRIAAWLTLRPIEESAQRVIQ